MSKTGQKILYIFDQGDWQSRMPAARRARDEGFDVTVALAGGPIRAAPESGFVFLNIPAPEDRFTPAALLKMVRAIRTLIRRERPALIHTVTLKYAFITGLAALSFPGVKTIYTLAGLGYLFRSDDTKSRMIRILFGPVLKHILKARGTVLIFQNPDDRALMIKEGFAEEARSVLIRGSGVDLQRFTPPPARLARKRPLVLMPTRLVHEKGVHVFAEAAKILKDDGIAADFKIAGGLTRHNPRALSAEDMAMLTRGGAVEWMGKVDDMAGLLQEAALVVYPSYYGEGIPRVLLEACAAGRAIVTTDHPGCREAVAHGQNGLLVPVRDAPATARAIAALLADSEKRRRMGKESRRRAEKYFDINIIAEQTLAVYRQCTG